MIKLRKQEPTSLQQLGRVTSLDALRGLIMILMAIDHASYFIGKIHPGEFWGLALPQYSSTVSFMTRWITHLCAPGFFFLMGTGMVLFAASRRVAGWSENSITRFFITRGIVLILLQLLVENPAWLLGMIGEKPSGITPPGGGGEVFLHFGVLYGLGATMIVFSLLLRVRPVYIALLSIGSILLTQWLTPSASDTDTLYSPLLRLILIPGHTGIWQSFYPLIPWLGITGLGVVFGKSLKLNAQQSFRYLLMGGTAFLILFLLIRWVGGFGNLQPVEDGWMVFLNVTKYPPSLAYILLTLGINGLLLYLFTRIKNSLARYGRPLLVFGRSALFFYIVHLYLYALLGFVSPDGASYPMIYLFWLIGLIILFPLCLAYGKFKKQKPASSLWRLF